MHSILGAFFIDYKLKKIGDSTWFLIGAITEVL